MNKSKNATLNEIKQQLIKSNTHADSRFDLAMKRANENKFATSYLNEQYPTVNPQHYTDKMRLEAGYAYWNLLNKSTHMLTLTFSNNPYPISVPTLIKNVSNYLNRVDLKILKSKARNKNPSKRQRIKRRTYMETGKQNNNPHVHILIKKPNHISNEDFEYTVRMLFGQIDRAANARIERIYDMAGAITYPLKEIVALEDENLLPQLCA